MTKERHFFSFDTHEHVKELVKTGFKEPQAEAIVKTFIESRDYDVSNLATIATKDDIAALKSDMVVMKSDIEVLKSDMIVLKSDIEVLNHKIEASAATVQANILKWMIPFFLTIAGMILTIMFKILNQ